MTNLLIIFVATFFLPLLFRSWRVALLGLGVQGLLLAILTARLHHEWTAELVVEIVGLLAIRTVFVPWYLFRRMQLAEEQMDLLAYLVLIPSHLYRRMQGLDPASDFSLIARSFLQWTLAFLLVVAAFVFGQQMSPGSSAEALHVGSAAGAIVIGLLVLANQGHPLGQIIGLLTIESGIALAELLTPDALPWAVRVGADLTFVVLIVTCGQYLNQILAIPAGPEAAEIKEVL